jgi:hypothetical protein
MNYENQKDCHLMVWETEPNKRNVNNEVKFNIPNTTNVEIGDQIRCKQGGGKNSCYEIVEILETRPSSLPKFNYVTAKINWFVN